jgi:hypothetical protein
MSMVSVKVYEYAHKYQPTWILFAVVESRRIPNRTHTLKILRDILIADALAVPMLVNKVDHIGKGCILR